MTTMLRVQPDTLDALSARLGALRTHDLETIQRELRAITRALDASWESVAASDFRHAYGHWLDGYHRRCAELAAVERFLRAVAVGYRETEARLIGAVDSSDRGASKVLARSVAQGPAPNPVDAPPNVRFKLPNDLAAQAISEAEAQRLFALLAADPQIAFDYPLDGCYARAELMNDIIRAETGADPLKVWAFMEDLDDNGNGVIENGKNGPVSEIDPTVPPLWLSTTTPYGAVAWGWHVAPMVPVVGVDGIVHYRVIDPSVGSGPLSTNAWFTAIHATGAVEADWTRPGDAPENYPGTGYWLIQDPVIPDHAERTNAFYNYCAANGLKCVGVSPSTGQGYQSAVEPAADPIPVPEHLWWP